MVLVMVEININVDMQVAYCSQEVGAIENHAAKKCGGRTCERKSKHHDRAGELQKANKLEQKNIFVSGEHLA